MWACLKDSESVFVLGMLRDKSVRIAVKAYFRNLLDVYDLHVTNTI